jgi:hypothetical protein
VTDSPSTPHAQDALGLLTDPFLQRPEPDTTEVAWFTEFVGDRHYVVVGDGVAMLSHAALRAAITRGDAKNVRLFVAKTIQLSCVAEDADSAVSAERKPASGIVAREIYRHHAPVAVPAGTREPYRVISVQDDDYVASDIFTIAGPPRPGEPAVIMLTSDHQLMVNTPANLEWAAGTITAQLGKIDAVFMAGDMVNVPDRASEWFDDQRGAAFFPAMQGRAGREGTDGVVYSGGQILQHAPIFTTIGNHEVQGRRDGHTSLYWSYAGAVPRDVAEVEAGEQEDPLWLVKNSFSTTTYEEIFSLPRSVTGGERYYATTVGDVRLVTLFGTRSWGPDGADPDPAARESTTRYQDAYANLGSPLTQCHGEFIFEDLSVGSLQYVWLQQELGSPEFRSAKYTVVMLHEGPYSLGKNAMPQFAHPQRVEEHNERGELIGIRYDYPAAQNVLLRDLVPLLESAGVDLVYSGHSHLWNRFVSPNGVNYLEASNTGNSYGAFLPISGMSRPAPPAPWNTENHVAQGSPGRLSPVVPTVAPLLTADGQPQPYVADNNFVVFQALHTGTGVITSWYVDMADVTSGPVRFDEFQL